MHTEFGLTEFLFFLLCTKNPKSTRAYLDSLSPQKRLVVQQKEWFNFWNRLQCMIPDFKEKVIVDYGCGYGFDSLFALQKGAKHLYALEVSTSRLEQSMQLHETHGFSNVTYINNENVSDLTTKIGNKNVDIVLCRDVMEHVSSPAKVLKSIHDILKTGGLAYIGLSPFFRSPYGAHIRSKCALPWVHLIFSEKTVIKVFKKLYNLSKNTKKYIDIEGSGVNKLSYFEYLNIIHKFDWIIENNYINSFPDRGFPANLLNIMIKISPFQIIKELFIVNSYVTIRKDTI